MTTIAIPLSDEKLARLRDCAEQQGVTPEEFLSSRVDQLLDQTERQFQDAANYVLQKNAEIYRRLA